MRDYNKEFNDNKNEYNKELANAERHKGQQTKTNKMSDTIYCGSGNKRSDTWITATINLAKFKDHIQEYKGHKFLKLNINIKSEVDRFGKDVQITINEFKGNPEQMVGDGHNEFKKEVKLKGDMANEFNNSQQDSFDDNDSPF